MDLKRYIYSHCVSPVHVRIWDAYSQSYKVREVPCGKCLHCHNTHINEWVTRLIAQRKYSKFCYYVSLDYAPFDESNEVAMRLAMETAAVHHDINKYHTYGLQPLVLCKNHLQDFFKRLRKNTNVKLQYFSCGEYGMHANGHGFGRPHFHNLIFCDNILHEDDFIKAWTIDGYKIGRVDFQDMTPYAIGSNNLIKSFKYVCKYLQKWDFDFEKLATIDFHRAFFKSLQVMVVPPKDLFDKESKVPIEDRQLLDERWREYIKQYSPFVVCSRRPSIGSAYLVENLERFKAQDFRLFGLPKDCVAFPRYYVRRTKEALYPARCIGELSEEPTTCSRMGRILSLLAFMSSTRNSIDTWREKSPYNWCIYKDKFKGNKLCVKYDTWTDSIPCREFSFYDSENKFLYQFNGFNYHIWAKLKNGTYVLYDSMDINDVLHEFKPSWDNFYHEYLTPLHIKQVLNERDLINSIECYYQGSDFKESYDMFLKDVWSAYKVELDTMYKTKLLMQNSKLDL